jgi:hypothetical protein
VQKPASRQSDDSWNAFAASSRKQMQQKRVQKTQKFGNFRTAWTLRAVEAKTGGNLPWKNDTLERQRNKFRHFRSNTTNNNSTATQVHDKGCIKEWKTPS